MKIAAEAGTQKLLVVLGRYKYLLLVVAVGLVLLLWPKGEDSPKAASAEEYPSFSVSEMETKLEKVLSQIEGAGRTEVILTLKSDMEIILQQDAKTRQYREMEDGALTVQESENEFKTVLSGGSSSGQPIVVKRLYPQFQGALVVCQGARNSAVQMAVIEAVAALTGLKSSEITVATMKK